MNHPQINAAKAYSQNSGYVSISELQRSLLLGYTEAKNILDQLIQINFCEAQYTQNHGHKIIKEVLQ